jgi:putative peptidoglycan lipid II flippase
MSATMNAMLLYFTLRKRNIYVLSSTTIWLVIKIILASGLMAAAIYQFNPLPNIWVGFSFLDKVVELAQLIVLGAIIFVVSLLLLGVRKSTFSSKNISA